MKFLRRSSVAAIQWLLQIAYHLLYYQLACAYDLAAWIVSAGEWAEWRRCVLPYLPAGPILEAAHGTGTLALEMAARGFAVTAFDLSPAMSRIARRKRQAAMRKHSAGIRIDNPFFLRANICNLPAASESFACAVSTFPAEFVLDPAAMREIRRVLRPGGRWIIVPTAYPIWLESIFQKHARQPALFAMERAIQNRMAASGFRLRTEYIRRPHSVVVVWIAEI